MNKISGKVALSEASTDFLVQTGFFGSLPVDEIAKLEVDGVTYAMGVTIGPDYDDGVVMDLARFDQAVGALVRMAGVGHVDKTGTHSDSPSIRYATVEHVNGGTKGIVFYDEVSNSTIILRGTTLTDDQWSFASGDSELLRNTGVDITGYLTEFLPSSFSFESLDENTSFNDGIPDRFRIGDEVNGTTQVITPTAQSITDLQTLNDNLAYALFHTWVSNTTAGYAFDQGYYEAVKAVPNYDVDDPYHGGIDFGAIALGGGSPSVYSPIDGHVIQIFDSGSPETTYLVVRETDGDRIWIFGHVEANSELELGSFVKAGSELGTMFASSGDHLAHLHLMTSKSAAAHGIIPTQKLVNDEWVNINGSEALDLNASEFPETNLRFAGTYSWQSEFTASGWWSFGISEDVEKLLALTDSPLQAFFEENPFSAVELGIESQTQEQRNHFFDDLIEIGGGLPAEDNEIVTDGLEQVENSAGDIFDEGNSPNIRVTGQEWSGSAFAPYDLLRVDVNYTNDGPGDTGPINVALYMSQDETFTADEIVHQVRFEEGVFENGTHNVWFETYLPGAEGEYHMRVTIDASGEIVESNESDNHATTVISIGSDVSVGSDQRIVSATLSESEIQAGERPQFSVDIENTGAAGSGTTQLAYYRSTTTNFADAVFLGNRSVNVEAGATHTETLSLPETWTNDLASGQTYYFFAVANDEQAGSETDFSDNVSAAVALSIATQASQGDGADLIVTNQLLNGAVDENLFMVSYHIQNVGNIETNQRVEHSIWISHDEHFDPNQDSLLDVYQSSSGQIAANGVSREMVTVNYNSYQDDPFYIFILADRENLIPEQNESNNVSDAILVQPATQPDLLSDQVIVSVELSESEIEAGERPQLTVEIENTGGVGSGTTQLAYYRSETSNFSDAEFLGNRSVNVDAGATHTETLSLPETWTSSLTEGQTYYLFAVANDEQAGSEIDFSDNISVPLALAITNGAIVGTDGNDTLEGTDGDDFLEGGRGDDVLVGGVGDDTLNGGDGSDTASYATSAGRVAVFLARTQDVGGSQGIDTFISIENVIGSGFNDRLVGDEKANVLTGGLGDDVLIGNAGNDILNGGNGNDLLTGSGGNDVLNGGEGEDILSGLGGADILNGGAGDDEVLGGLGLDIVNGGTGEDDIFGFFGADTINGDAGDDNIRAGGSGDIVNGGDGNDRMVGANGKDTLWGGAGNDIYFGGFGTGGDGLRDVFVFKSASNGGGGFDIIKDFENNIDKIDLSESGHTTFVEVLAGATQVGANVQINFDFSGLLVIENFSLTDFNSGDVLF
ncbi:MAG: CARDB domain-containing protein [Aliishimia sp.]